MQTKCRSLLLLFVLFFPTVHLSRKSGRLSPAAHKDTHCCVIIICPCAFHLVLGKSQPRKKIYALASLPHYAARLLISSKQVIILICLLASGYCNCHTPIIPVRLKKNPDTPQCIGIFCYRKIKAYVLSARQESGGKGMRELRRKWSCSRLRPLR